MKEIWKAVDEWPYEVSNTGKVRNIRTGKEIKSVKHKSGYLNVQMWNKGKFKSAILHRLVAIAFHGIPQTDKHEVAHSDGDRHNNNASNLRWVTHAENMRDRDRHGTTARGKRNGKLKYNDEIVHSARSMSMQGKPVKEIASKLSIHPATAYGYINGTRRQTLEFRG
jgi:hypothetical protein